MVYFFSFETTRFYSRPAESRPRPKSYDYCTSVYITSLLSNFPTKMVAPSKNPYYNHYIASILSNFPTKLVAISNHVTIRVSFCNFFSRFKNMLINFLTFGVFMNLV